MKEHLITPPTMYLGSNVRKFILQDENGHDYKVYGMGSQTYVKESIRIVERLKKSHNLEWSSTRRQGHNSPFSSSDYCPELDSTDFIDDELITVDLDAEFMISSSSASSITPSSLELWVYN